VNIAMNKFTNFENHEKLMKNCHSDNFFAVVIRRKRKFILGSEKNLWGWHLKEE